MASWADTVGNLNSHITQLLGQSGKTITDIGNYQVNQQQLRQNDRNAAIASLMKVTDMVNQNQQLSAQAKARLGEIAAQGANNMQVAQSDQEARRELQDTLDKFNKEQNRLDRENRLQAARIASGARPAPSSTDLTKIFSDIEEKIFVDHGWTDPTTGQLDFSKADKAQFAKELQALINWRDPAEQQKILAIADSIPWGTAPPKQGGTGDGAGTPQRSDTGARVLSPKDVPGAIVKTLTPVVQQGVGTGLVPFADTGRMLGQALSGREAPVAVTERELPAWQEIQTLLQAINQGNLDPKYKAELQKDQAELEGRTGFLGLNVIGETMKGGTTSKNLPDIQNRINALLARLNGTSVRP